MRKRAWTFLLLLTSCLQPHAALGAEISQAPASLVRKIPARPSAAMSGSQFARHISGMDETDRDQAICAQLIQGNAPAFLRRLKRVRLVHEFEDGRKVVASIFVMPDYLAIGSDRDFLLIPMSFHTAARIATAFGFTLPTSKMVDAIFEQSAFHFAPAPLPAGPAMRSTAYYVRHNERIKKQRQAARVTPGTLVSGHKKDVVLTNRLDEVRGRLAIYGWHRRSGIPIQPLSTAHPASYADYSHGIRLVSDTAFIDDKPRSVYDVLKDPTLASVLSDEGVIPAVQRAMMLARR